MVSVIPMITTYCFCSLVTILDTAASKQLWRSSTANLLVVAADNRLNFHGAQQPPRSGADDTFTIFFKIPFKIILKQKIPGRFGLLSSNTHVARSQVILRCLSLLTIYFSYLRRSQAFMRVLDNQMLNCTSNS